MTTSYSLLLKLVAGVAIAAALTSRASADSVPLDQAKLSGDETIQTPIGEFKLKDNYFDEMDYQRAAQAMSGVPRWSASRPGATIRARPMASRIRPTSWCSNR
jgi:hypothetical protein